MARFLPGKVRLIGAITITTILAIGASPSLAVEATTGSMVLQLTTPGKKLRLVSAAQSEVNFDLNGDGSRERTGWIGGPTVGLLAIDFNRNGRIDNGKELISSATPAGRKRGAHAYEVLSQYDKNRDGVINRADAVFYSLRIWVDKNRNGRTDRRELFSLAQMKVTSIAISYTATGTRQKKQFSNSIGYESRFFGPKQCGDTGCRSLDVTFGAMPGRNYSDSR